MNVGASEFKPSTATKANPISFLNRGSVSDDKPLIVSSPVPAKNDSTKAKAPIHPSPIGTMSPGYSPTEKRHPADFTTDAARGGKFMGTHYVVIKNVDPVDLGGQAGASVSEVSNAITHSL